MKELLNYKTITQITDTYIFTRACGESGRVPISKEYLTEAHEVFREEFEFYNRMLDELCLEQKALEDERNALSRRLERLEKRKEETADDPLVRRGLGTVNWEIEVTDNAIIELVHRSNGVATVQKKILDKTMNYLRLQKEAETVYNKFYR